MRPLHQILASLYRDTPYRDEWLLARLEGSWQGLLGENIARVCRPRSFRNGSLEVEIRDEAWFGPLTAMKRELMQRVRTVSGDEVRRIHFSTSGGSEKK